MNFLKVIEHRRIYLSIALVFVLGSWFFILWWGLHAGIDLKGGAEWQFNFKNKNVEASYLREVLIAEGLKDVTLTKLDQNTFLLRSADLNSLNRERYLKVLNEKMGELEEKSFVSIGPSVSKELLRKARWAIFLVLLGISFYVTYAFRKVSYPISSWKYGLATLLALVHDVSIAMGFLAVVGKWKNVVVDTNAIVALLVVMGFSVHDTIVVFDRIREKLLLLRGKKILLKEVIEESVKETFARSVNTSLTLMLVLLALVLFGPQSLLYFVLTMMVGTFFGTYSSIFIASPLLYLLTFKKETSS